MTDKEILAMQGTEFIYQFEDGDTMKAYIKKICLKTNRMSCWSFSLKTDNGYKLCPKNEDEELEQAVCVFSSSNYKSIIEHLKEIKETGKLLVKPRDIKTLFPFTGCSFN